MALARTSPSRDVESTARFASSDSSCKVRVFGFAAGVQASCTDSSQLDAVGVLGECKLLARLDLSYNRFGEEGAERLAGLQAE
eukprot:2901769-Rhodomonas_salina.1